VSGILILTAVDLEARALARHLELAALSSASGVVYGRGAVRVATIGLGALLLTERGARLRQGLERPLVVSAGVCAGLDPMLRAGDVILPGSVLGPSGELHNVTPDPHRAARDHAASTGPLVTVEDIVSTPEDKAELFARTGAVAADMESVFILSWAAAAGCPCLVVRGVSDVADETLPRELPGLLTSDGRLDLGRALAFGVTRPSVVPRAIALGRATATALHAVGRVLGTLAA